MARVPLPRSVPRLVLALGALVLLAVAAAAWWLRPEALRARLATTLEAALERPVRVSGPVRIGLAGQPSIVVEGLELPAADGFALAIDRVEAGVAWRDLLDGRLALGTVRITAPRLVVDTRARAAASRAATSPSVAAPRSWSIARLEILDGRIEWLDAPDGRAAILDALQANVEGIAFDGAAGAYRVERASLAAALDPGPAPVAPGRRPLTLALDALDYVPTPGTLRAGSLRATALGIDLRLDAPTASLAGDAPAFDAKLALAPFDPLAVLAALGREAPPMQGPDALRRAALTAGISLRDGAWRIDALTLALDDSRLTGSAVVRPGARPWLAFDATLDRLDAERYREPVAPRGDEPVELPFERLRALEVEGRLRIGELRVAGAVLRGTTVELRP